MADGYLGVTAAAQRLGVSEETVRRWCDSGRLPSVRHPMSGHRQVRSDAVEKIISETRAVLT